VTVVGVAALVLAGCTGGSGGGVRSNGSHESTPGGTPEAGQRPVVIAGERTCPLTAPIPANGPVFYPTFYPQDAVPPADRCFESVALARGAGLRPAPPPPGDQLIGGVYLVSAGQALVPLCRAAARQLGYAVACPETVPAPVNAIERVTAAPDFLLEENFAAPLSYRGAGTTGRGPTATSRGHMWIESANERFDASSICGVGPPAPIPTTTPTSVRGGPAGFVSCAQGSSTHSGHVVLFWREAGDWHLVSLHGQTAVNRRIDVLIARSIGIVRP
jgi:hypothetical protein